MLLNYWGPCKNVRRQEVVGHTPGSAPTVPIDPITVAPSLVASVIHTRSEQWDW